MDTLDEMDKFLEMQSLPRLNHRETECLNRPVTGKGMHPVIRNPPTEKGFTTKHLKNQHQSFSDFSRRVQTSEGAEHKMQRGTQDSLGPKGRKSQRRLPGGGVF